MLERFKNTITGVFSAKNKPQDDIIEPEIESIDDTIYQDQIVSMVKSELERRKQERLPFELQWRLNINFLDGNQYCDINLATQDIQEIEKVFWWQEREVFNHIAPIMETRLAKLGRVRPAMLVQPATSDLEDISGAKVSTMVVESTGNKIGLPNEIDEASMWSEICGTSFYKDGWDTSGGRLLGVIEGTEIFEGDVNGYVCPPFEIFPDNNFASSIDECRSIIHAKAYHVDEIEELWGRRLDGGDIDVFSITSSSATVGGLGYTANIPKVSVSSHENHEIVLEYYERPSKRYPEGRFIVVAGDELLYYGALPYKIGEDGKRELPFVCQIAVKKPGCIWGISVIERLIPVQRSYNAVKNRKHEFMNRVAIGILDVEEGAYDLDDLEDDGLSPGKVLVRKKHAAPAQFLRSQDTPHVFLEEEKSLENQFILISGVSEISRNSQAPTGAGSGIALQILTEQEDTRLSLSAEQIRQSIMQRAKRWIRLYKQFVVGVRMDRLVGENGDVLVAQWSANDLTSDDVVIDTENELVQSPAQRKQMVFDMLQAGLFLDPDTGRMTKRMQVKILEAMGMGNWEATTDIEELQITRAQRENMMLLEGQIPLIREIDDDELHELEHKRFMLSGDFMKLIAEDPELADEMDFHVKQHRQARDLKSNNEMLKQQLMQAGHVPA